MLIKTSWNLAHTLMPLPDNPKRDGWREVVAKLVWKGLDHGREIRRLDPTAIEGWKWAGMLEFYREAAFASEPSPRFRLEFDPVFDLSPIRATYLLKRGLELNPVDANTLTTLASLSMQRMLNEEGLKYFDRVLALPVSSLDEKKQQEKVRSLRATIAAQVGETPASLKWENLSQLEKLLGSLYQSGRAGDAADLLESAYPAENRPWVISDRIATIRLHLGEPERAHKIWSEAKLVTSEALRKARVAVALFAKLDFDGARKSYQEAIQLDPKLFEAYYGLIVLEADMRNAKGSVELITRATQLYIAPHNSASTALKTLLDLIEPHLGK
jgi:tetratricopeptide (TPR) repeat protein